MVNAVVELRFIIQGEADQPGFVEVLGQYALVGVLIVSLKVHSGTVLKNHVLAQHSSDAAWGEFVRQIESRPPGTARPSSRSTDSFRQVNLQLAWGSESQTVSRDQDVSP